MLRKPSLAFVVGTLAACASVDDPVASDHGELIEKDSPARPDSLILPGAFFPESIAIAKDGALFTGNPTNGEIVTFAAGSNEAKSFVAAGVNTGTFGMKVDDARGVLWACDVDLTPAATPSHLRAFRLEDGTMERSIEVPTGGACADIAIGPSGVLYVTDIFRSTVMRLQPDATTFEADWCTSPLFAGSDPNNPLKLGGIDFVLKNGDEALFVDKRDSGDLFRIPIVNGACGAPLKLKLDRPLPLNDGIRAIDFDNVLVTINAKTPEALAAPGPIPGALVNVRVKGTTGKVDVIDDTLDQPTGVVIEGKWAWVSEGQILRLSGIDKTAPRLPFKLRRVRL